MDFQSIVVESAGFQAYRFKAWFAVNAYCLHKNHNAEDVRLKDRPVGRNPRARLYVITFNHAMSMLAKQCLDSDSWVSLE